MGSYYFTCVQGETFEAEFGLAADCDPFDLTHYTATMLVKDADGNTLSTLTSSPAAGLVISDPTGGVILATIAASVTAGYPVGVGSYLLSVSAGSTTYFAADGGFEVKAP